MPADATPALARYQQICTAPPGQEGRSQFLAPELYTRPESVEQVAAPRGCEEEAQVDFREQGL